MGDILKNRSNLHPQLEAVVGPSVRLTYRKLNQRVNQLAHYLQERNIRKGDRIAILCLTDHPFITILWVALKIGAIAVPLNYRLHPDELIWILEHSQPDAIFYDGDFSSSLPQTNEVPFIREWVQVSISGELHPDFSSIFATYATKEPNVELDGEDPAMLTYTSGTTGKPKGVIATHTNLYHPGPAAFSHVGFQMGDRALLPTPLFHISGSVMVTSAPYVGMTIVCMPHFHPHHILDLIEKERVTQAVGIGPMLQMILGSIMEENRELETLRMIVSGGAAVSVPIIKQFYALGFPVLQIYGLSEYTSVATFWHPDLMGIETCGSVGKNLIGQIKIVDPETENELPQKEVGEVVIRGPQLFKGYWKNPEETRKALRDGWFFTGDAGKMDENGFLYLVGRYKDVIHVGAEKVFPVEVENVLMDMDEVLEAAVVARNDPFWEEIPRAYVVKKADSRLTEGDVLTYVHKHLAPYKLAEVVFTEELPKNEIGKVMKNVLHKKANEEESSTASQ